MKSLSRLHTNHLLAFVLVICGLTTSARASVVSPSDKQYYSLNHDGYLYIYTDEHRLFIPEIIEYNKHLRKLYEITYDWVLDEKTNFGIASNNSQISNGFATFVPHLETIFYPNGLGIYDFMNGKSWLHNLLIHETAHLYQLNVKPPTSSVLKYVFGSPSPMAGSLFSYMIHPNAFAPTFMVEGNATFMESIFDNGGRLRSGANYALLLQLAKANKINSRRLINSHLYFPYGREKYLIGGFFNAYLANKYGLDTTNKYFANQASHFINPFRLDAAFKETFGKGYDLEINEFYAELLPLSKQQESAEGTLIAQSTFDNPLSILNDKVYFLDERDGKDTAHLVEVDAQGVVTKTPSTLAAGKVFKVGESFYTGTALPVNTNHLKSGLFNEDLELLHGTENKHYTEYLGPENTIYGDVEKSFNGPIFFHNSEKIENCHSFPTLVSSSSWACFQQNGQTRTLIQDGKKIFDLKDYYTKVIGGHGSKIYFIGSTKFGSSLFYYENGKIFRLSSSDTLIDAKVFSNNSAIITEVSDTGFNYKYLQQLTLTPETPSSFNNFLSDTLIQEPFNPKNISTELLNTETTYGALKNLRFSSFEPTFGMVSAQGLYTNFSILFADPLGMNSISATYGSIDGQNDYFFEYNNSKYLLPFAVGYLHDDYSIISGLTSVKSKIHYAFANTAIPLFRKGIWSSQMSFTATNLSDTEGTTEVENSNALTSRLTITRKRTLPLAMYSSSLFKFSLAHDIADKTIPTKEKQDTYSGVLNVENQVGDDSYLFLNYKGSVQDGASSNIRLSPSPLSLSSPSAKLFYRMTDGASKKYLELQKVSMGFKKGFPVNWYSTWFPIGVRQSAYVMNLSYFYGRVSQDKSLTGEFNEYGHGLDTEFLMLHKIPFRVLMMAARNNLEKNDPIFTSVIINFKESF